MIRLSKVIFLILIFAIMNFNFVFAHPGRTDSNGGHYVRTEGWGYPVGSYHYHNNTQTQKSNEENDYSYYILYGIIGLVVLVGIFSQNKKEK